VEDVYFPPGAFTYCFVTYSSMEGVDVLMATRPHKVLGTEIKPLWNGYFQSGT